MRRREASGAAGDDGQAAARAADSADCTRGRSPSPCRSRQHRCPLQTAFLPEKVRILCLKTFPHSTSPVFVIGKRKGPKKPLGNGQAVAKGKA
ncbi:hypothetical protein E5288_WYG010468 [Bos mutus]|uniref:Uncharacterized protein n=1 Tax=Bos mutus TaxID=72004 RepID=A0A6B0S3Y8_9CETA|nr:hypothetical protein [Bos mutus]